MKKVPRTAIGTGGGGKSWMENVDAELVLHTMIEYPNYDQAVIVKYSRLLREFSPHITYLNRLREKIGATKTRGIS